LIYWLVGRAVRPLARIVSALQQLEHGRFDVVLPPLPGREAAAIGSAFNRMVAELAGHIETERRAVRAELQLSDSRELTRWVDRHLEEERRLIARELHDELGQSVTAMRSMALSVAQRVKTTEPEAAKAASLIADEASRLYDAMHGIIPRLTPLVLDRLGLADALKDLAERTRHSQPEVRVDLDVDLSDAVIPAAAALAVYRAAQEGITNALRHGHARHLQLALCCKDREVTMTVIDDGRGLPEESGNAEFHTSPGGHHGLRWMADRVEGLGGRVSLTPNLPSGARLQLHFPLRPLMEGTP
jgi:two-component system sensor histidine kinase UhpB